MSLAACWVDHALRPAAELSDERSFVMELCRRIAVPLLIEEASRGEILGIARDSGGIESAARIFRYAALERARISSGCGSVLTGHTEDDFVETMVMRFCTGSGTAGLRGIPEANGHIVRPLLGVSKNQIYAYLASKGQRYRTDSTNASDDYLRNKVRHEVLPVLLSVFPSLRASLGMVSIKAGLDEAALAGMADSLLVPAPSGCAISVAVDTRRFDKATVSVRIRALYRLSLRVVSGRLPWRLVKAAAISARLSGRLASGCGIEFVREGSFLLARPFERNHEGGRAMDAGATAGAGFGFLVDGPGEYRIGKAGICRIYFAGQAPGLRLDAFSWPLWIRSRRPGDSIRTGAGSKMVDSLLSETAIPAGLRDSVPLVEDRGGVVALLGSAAGGRDVYRRNDSLAGVPASGFLVMDMEGAAVTDAIRR